jgi:hypothetical protein
MKKSLLIIIALLLSIYGCSDDTGTNTGDVVEDEEVLLAVDTIGTGGGTFDAGVFQLLIPPGAFDSDTELMLYESSEEHGFGDNCISDFVRLLGLPEGFAESLTVRLEYEGTPGSDVLVGVAQMATFLDDDYDTSEALAFDFYSATESAGYLEAVIPATPPLTSQVEASPVEAGSRMDNHFAALKNLRHRGHSEHVRITYPIYLYEHMDELAGYLEAAHDTVVSIGMGYEGRYWKWPLRVVVRDLSVGSSSVVMPVRYDISHSKGFKIQIHQDFVIESNLPWLKYFLGNAMAGAAQHIPSEHEFHDGDHYPWNCAVAAWIQGYWPAPGYTDRPRHLTGNEVFALTGMPFGTLGPRMGATYGGGWSPVVKYLVDRNGKSLIGNVYRATQTTDEKPMPDLMARVHPIMPIARSCFPRFSVATGRRSTLQQIRFSDSAERRTSSRQGCSG